MEEFAPINHCLVVADMPKALAEKKGVKDAVRSGLFEPFGRGVYSLVGGGEGARGQHFDVLSMADLGACVDNFLVGFEEFLGELSKLENFSFDERVAQSSHSAID